MTTKKGVSNLSRIGCVFRKGKWIDASEEIDKAIARAYEDGKKISDSEIKKIKLFCFKDGCDYADSYWLDKFKDEQSRLARRLQTSVLEQERTSLKGSLMTIGKFITKAQKRKELKKVSK